MRLDSLLKKRLKMFRGPKGGWAQALCPFHEDSSPSFFVNMESGFWHCFGCGIKGWLPELFERLRITEISADKLVKKGVIKRRDPNEVNFLPDYILAAYRKCPVRLLSAGFDKELLQRYDVGFDERNYRITFPIRSVDGRLAAVSGRNLNAEPKYQIYEEEYRETFPDYKPRPKDHLWNLNHVYEDLVGGEVETLYIVEGYKACLWLVQHGFSAVATMGAGMSREQLKIFSMFDVPLVLFLDDDEAGFKATLFNYLDLSGVQLAKVAQYPEGATQPDDLDKETLTQTLNNPITFRRYYEQGLSRQTQKIDRSFHARRKKVFFKKVKAL